MRLRLRLGISPPVSVDSEVKISMQEGTTGATSVDGGRLVVQVSSNANNELNASDFLLNSNNATSNANVNITSGDELALPSYLGMLKWANTNNLIRSKGLR